jgi:hypothetical protein
MKVCDMELLDGTPQEVSEAFHSRCRRKPISRSSFSHFSFLPPRVSPSRSILRLTAPVSILCEPLHDFIPVESQIPAHVQAWERFPMIPRARLLVHPTLTDFESGRKLVRRKNVLGIQSCAHRDILRQFS